MSVKHRSQLVVAALTAALCLALVAIPAARPSVGSLRHGIAAARARERALAASVGDASRLLGVLTRQLTILNARVSDVQTQLALDRARLTGLRVDVVAQRARAARLRARFATDRAELVRWLVAAYEDGRPDVVEVLFQAQGFSDLLERLDFMHRLSSEEGAITRHARSERNAAQGALVRLRELTAAQVQTTTATASESAALQSIDAELQARSSAIDRVRAFEVASLRRTRTQRLQLQRRLTRALAALLAPAFAAPPGTSFSIPWPIVQCESGGQNLPPNSAGASGYYQIVPATWKDFGGSTPQAYQAPKAEQDAVAARIYNGGAGASNWVCASLVGVS